MVHKYIRLGKALICELQMLVKRFLSDDLILLMEGSPQRSCQTQTMSVWDVQLVNGSEGLPEVAVEVVCLTAVYHLQWQKMLLKLFGRIGYVMNIELVQGLSPEGLRLNLYVHFRIRIITNVSLGEVWWEPFENVVTDTNTVHQSEWRDRWCHLLQVK